MEPNVSVEILFNAILKALKETTENKKIGIVEICEALFLQLKLAIDVVCKDYTTLQQVNDLEKLLVSQFENYLKPTLRTKQQFFEDQLTIVQKGFSKEQLSTQAKKMLSNKIMTLDEGINFIGDLVGTITYTCKENIESQEQAKQLESQILDHIKGKLDLALSTIQIEQDLVTKH